MKHSKEFENFTNLVDRVLAVPHSVIQERIDQHRKQADKNPRKRGPKAKAKPPASARASSSGKKRAA
jgi:hypothetical protein